MFALEGFDVMTVDEAGLISDHTGYWDLADLRPVAVS